MLCCFNVHLERPEHGGVHPVRRTGGTSCHLGGLSLRVEQDDAWLTSRKPRWLHTCHCQVPLQYCRSRACVHRSGRGQQTSLGWTRWTEGHVRAFQKLCPYAVMPFWLLLLLPFLSSAKFRIEVVAHLGGVADVARRPSIKG